MLATSSFSFLLLRNKMDRIASPGRKKPKMNKTEEQKLAGQNWLVKFHEEVF